MFVAIPLIFLKISSFESHSLLHRLNRQQTNDDEEDYVITDWVSRFIKLLKFGIDLFSKNSLFLTFTTDEGSI